MQDHPNEKHPDQRDEDTQAILSRRDFLIKTALAGAGASAAAAAAGCGPKTCLKVVDPDRPKPQTCLDVDPPDPPKKSVTNDPPEPQPCRVSTAISASAMSEIARRFMRLSFHMAAPCAIRCSRVARRPTEPLMGGITYIPGPPARLAS